MPVPQVKRSASDALKWVSKHVAEITPWMGFLGLIAGLAILALTAFRDFTKAATTWCRDNLADTDEPTPVENAGTTEE